MPNVKGIPQEANATGNTADRLTWGRLPEGDQISSGTYALSARSSERSGCDLGRSRQTSDRKALGDESVRDKDRVAEEPDEAKVSRPVLKQRQSKRLLCRL